MRESAPQTPSKASNGRSRQRLQFSAIAVHQRCLDVGPCSVVDDLRKDPAFLNIVDEHTRQCMAIKVGWSITSDDAIDTLAELFAMHGVPKRLRCDNGPEFISKAIKSWLAMIGVEVLYIEPGSPWQNGLCESFNSRLRDEYLHRTEQRGLEDARLKARAWREDFNDRRPHSSLGYLTPSEFAHRCAASAPVAALQLHSEAEIPLPVS